MSVPPTLLPGIFGLLRELSDDDAEPRMPSIFFLYSDFFFFGDGQAGLCLRAGRRPRRPLAVLEAGFTSIALRPFLYFFLSLSGDAEGLDEVVLQFCPCLVGLKCLSDRFDPKCFIFFSYFFRSFSGEAEGELEVNLGGDRGLIDIIFKLSLYLFLSFSGEADGLAEVFLQPRPCLVFLKFLSDKFELPKRSIFLSYFFLSFSGDADGVEDERLRRRRRFLLARM